jgi:Biopterin-dependent aromatic amino acid hydroxylase
MSLAIHPRAASYRPNGGQRPCRVYKLPMRPQYVARSRSAIKVIASPRCNPPRRSLVPDEVFFEHLANRRFPAGQFIRKRNQLDYLEEPDVFHDVFGHVSMLLIP